VKIFQYLLGLIFFLLPRKFIEVLLANDDRLKNRYYFSGRVAIYRIALALKNNTKIAIVPKYICNVVHFALLEAGYTLVTYECNEDFEPNIAEIINLGQQFPNSVLCLAPLYGADGGESWIASDYGKKWRNDNDIFLIFDICQDYSRFTSNILQNDRNFAIISSFNNKSFPGLMGASTLSDVNDGGYKPARALEIFYLFIILIKEFLYFVPRIVFKAVKSEKKIQKYDYSYCTKFPFDFNHSGAAKIQLAVGLAGKIFLPFYMTRKKVFIKENVLVPKKTPYFMTASIVILEVLQPSSMFIKPPYAFHGKPNASDKPNLITGYFRGYQD
jgi:hypothetical protein